MGRLGIIAASGSLPLKLANRARAQGEDPYIIILTGQCDDSFEGFETGEYPPGQLAAIRQALQAAKCDRLVLVGKFTRPSLAGLKLDKEGAALFGRLALKGDDQGLRLLAEYFAGHNMVLLENSLFLNQQIVPAGYHFGRPLTDIEKQALGLAQHVLHQLGQLDVGQAVIVQQQRVLAIEGAEGSTAMILRTAELIDHSADGALFLKMAKSGQDIRLDMPVIGLETIEALHKIGIQVIALEAGNTMLANSVVEIEALLANFDMVLTAIIFDHDRNRVEG